MVELYNCVASKHGDKDITTLCKYVEDIGDFNTRNNTISLDIMLKR